ncbi:MAG: ParA family protein [Candidatus Thalassarchaeaceae archaeon]|nr:ParA family protein [Candidatus Thalassarchaeaceae archaeon]
MTIVIACVNHKGGCSRTTTAVNLASALALGSEDFGISPRRVLLVDMDPKGNVATTFGVNKRSVGPSMNELFSREVGDTSLGLKDCTLGPEMLTESMRAAWKSHNPSKKRGPPKAIAISNLWILPADLDLAGIEVDLVTRVGRENRLRLALQEAREEFDVIIIDTPASIGLLTINALSAAEWVMIPIQAEFYALEGMGQLMTAIRDVQRTVNTDLKLFGILMTMVQTRSRLCETVAEQARKHFGDRVFKVQIPRSVSIAESPLEGAPIVITQRPIKSNRASLAYWQFASEADERIREISEAEAP